MARKLFGKSKEKPVQDISVTNTPPNSWICAKCGATNSNASLSCKDCGAYK